VIETTPYDSLFAQSDEFSNRVARNTQLILSEESHLNHVTDPGGGSYYIETLTNEIANKAWAYFREIEEEGGIVAALHSGKINNDIAAVAEKRIKDAATRKAVLVGVNSYVNVKEAVKAPKPLDSAAVYKRRADELQKLRVQGSPEHNREILIKLQEAADENNTELTVEKATEAALLGATLGELFNHLKGSSDTTEVPALQVARPAEQFENLHLRAAAHLAKTGDRIKVYLFTVGPVKQYKARADFSRGFFEAGGCRVITETPLTRPLKELMPLLLQVPRYLYSAQQMKLTQNLFRSL
jgi:Methylmalonyl-CoA mutase, N-terminal domain/subunit